MNRARKQRGGQALVMVTLALMAMFGLMGLAVDLGWAFYVEKKAQAAADAAALAAVTVVFNAPGGASRFSCGGGVATCAPDPVPCPAGGNLASACLYAAQNGFTHGGRLTVTVQASDASTPPTVSGCTPLVNHPPTAPCVDTEYWVTVRVSERIPQLFSAILGNRFGTASSRATAAVAQAVDDSSLVLLNREFDPNYSPGAVPPIPTGTNLLIGGGAEVRVPGGIRLASTAGGPDSFAGDFVGKGGGEGAVFTPQTLINGVSGQGGLPDYVKSRWESWFANRPDARLFRDPFEDLGQPPLANRDVTLRPVPGGLLDNVSVCPAGICPEGVYFSTQCCSADGKQIPNGAPIVIPKGTSLRFDGGAFGEFIFFGGLQRGSGGGGDPAVDFAPGRYVMAGVKAAADGENAVLDTGTATKFTGGGANPDGTLKDAGRLFILTDSTYPGLQRHINNIDADVGRFAPRTWTDGLRFGYSNFKSGSTPSSSISLQGIDKLNPSVGQETNQLGYRIQDIANLVIWQDQRNSNIQYQKIAPNVTNGVYETSASCGGTDIDHPCLNDPPRDRRMDLSANQYTALEGIIYQPRGATVYVWAGTGYMGPIKLISGGLRIHGRAELTLTGPLYPTTALVAALVE